MTCVIVEGVRFPVKGGLGEWSRNRARPRPGLPMGWRPGRSVRGKPGAAGRRRPDQGARAAL
ncbi:hypothetical protein HMPREF0724_13832 [Prescottella equi ATCC 33707]|uniref:Uncharacterized protein n=1 Tax=Prescottella equi ATCC 33707 TaxID=525370 RepID=E9T5K4_RHOHA|nr:hypothetical protein HMPREF0724_13832 [Prescottella equi ATCC 33707]